MELFGCTCLAFGPPFALCYFTIAHDPVRIIIAIASAFFWLVALLLSSVWWALIPLRDSGEVEVALVFSILVQEAFRLLVYAILRKAEGGLKKVTQEDAALIDNKHILAYVAGLGFGVMSGAFALINLLADSVGPGTVGLRGGGDSPRFLVATALLTLAFILLHTAWNVVFCDALDKRRWFVVAGVVLMHFAASFLTLFNRSHHLYWVSIPGVYLILVVSIALALRTSEAKFGPLLASSSRNPVTLRVID